MRTLLHRQHALDHRLGGVLLIATSAALWSTAGLFTRAVDADAWTILFWRSLFGFLFIAPVLVVQGQSVRRPPLSAVAMSDGMVICTSTIAMVVFIPALKLTNVANVAVIYAALPVITAILSWIVLRETLSARVWLAAIATFCGAVIVFAGSSTVGGEMTGNALALIMTLSMAVMALALRRGATLQTPTIIALSTLLATAISWPFADPFAVSTTGILILAAFGLVQMTLGLTCFMAGARRLNPTTTALVGAIETPLSPLWVWWVFGEVPTTATVLGGTIIVIAAGVYLVTESKRPEPPVASPLPSNPKDTSS